MISLGIEGSANKVGIGILNDTTILTNKRYTFIPGTGSGMLPKEIQAHHRAKILPLLKQALDEAGISIKEIDCICYTKGPGIHGPLLVCAIVARVLALFLNIPLIPVNHCVAHIEMGRFITNTVNPVVLYVSGGNSQVIVYCKNHYQILGETLDIAIGNCLDRIARCLGLSNDPAPAYNVEQAAKKGKKFIKLPYSIKGMDFSFTGILTHVERVAKDHAVADLCFSVQETVFAMLVEATERAMAHTGTSDVLIVGGVGCNERLQEMMECMCAERGAKLFATDERYCVDNGLMIAYTGLLQFKTCKKYAFEECTVTQRYRTDTVRIDWRE